MRYVKLLLLAAVTLTCLFVINAPRPALARSQFIHTAALCRAKVKVKAKLEECLACVKDGGKFHFVPGAKTGSCIKK